MREGVIYRVKRPHTVLGQTFLPGEVWKLQRINEVVEDRVYYVDLEFVGVSRPGDRRVWNKSMPLDAESGKDIFEPLPMAFAGFQLDGTLVARAREAARSLCAELWPMLDKEIAAGNWVRLIEKDVGEKGAVHVQLAKVFQVKHVPPAGVAFKELNDPHWWKAEYCCARHKKTLACGFDE